MTLDMACMSEPRFSAGEQEPDSEKLRDREPRLEKPKKPSAKIEENDTGALYPIDLFA